MSSKKSFLRGPRTLLTYGIVTLLVTGLLSQLFLRANADTTAGSAAGNNGDYTYTTWKFRSDNQDEVLTRQNLTPISRSEVASLYGTADGMKVMVGGVDVASSSYSGGAKTPVEGR